MFSRQLKKSAVWTVLSFIPDIQSLSMNINSQCWLVEFLSEVQQVKKKRKKKHRLHIFNPKFLLSSKYNTFYLLTIFYISKKLQFPEVLRRQIISSLSIASSTIHLNVDKNIHFTTNVVVNSYSNSLYNHLIIFIHFDINNFLIQSSFQLKIAVSITQGNWIYFEFSIKKILRVICHYSYYGSYVSSSTSLICNT